MVGRVSQGYMVNDFIQNMNQKQEALQKSQNSLASGFRINLPSQDPVGTVTAMGYEDHLKEIKTYGTIITNNQAKINTVDSKLDSVTTIIHRLRELAVQGANGIYTADERQKIAVEVDQLTRQILVEANSTFNGEPIFGGTSTDPEPFKPIFQTDPKTGIEYLSEVRYVGNNQTKLSEVGRNNTVTINQPGNQVFWADNMEVYPTMPATGYVAMQNSKIMVDGVIVNVQKGDNLDTIAKKINESGAAVNAYIINDNEERYFNIETTSPHQISLVDLEGGRVLEDIGLIDGGMNPPYNYSPSAKVYTGNIFEAMIQFRKDLQNNDQYQIGGALLGKIDLSLDNILTFRANIGAVQERLNVLSERYANDEIYFTEAKDKTIGTDIATEMMNMKMLEFSHSVALNIGGRLLPKTLLDFLR